MCGYNTNSRDNFPRTRTLSSDISNALQNICIQIYLDYGLNLYGHVMSSSTWPLHTSSGPSVISYRCCIIIEFVSPAVIEINAKNIVYHTS